MFESYKCPLYSRPDQKPIPNNISITAKVGKTIVPLIGEPDTQDENGQGNKKEHYIWRTKHDDKVRLKHQFHDGKIFNINNPPDIGHPGDDYNCRCIKDFNIPDFVHIEKTNEQKMIRKHITNLFDFPNFCIK